jgi:uncharacterized membrane protein
MHKTPMQMVTLQEKFQLELLGSIQLIAGIILILLWSFYSTEWWSAAFGFLAVFFLIEAIWHNKVCDCLRHFKKAD